MPTTLRTIIIEGQFLGTVEHKGDGDATSWLFYCWKCGSPWGAAIVEGASWSSKETCCKKCPPRWPRYWLAPGQIPGLSPVILFSDKLLAYSLKIEMDYLCPIISHHPSSYQG